VLSIRATPRYTLPHPNESRREGKIGESSETRGATRPRRPSFILLSLPNPQAPALRAYEDRRRPRARTDRGPRRVTCLQLSEHPADDNDPAASPACSSLSTQPTTTTPPTAHAPLWPSPRSRSVRGPSRRRLRPVGPHWPQRDTASDTRCAGPVRAITQAAPRAATLSPTSSSSPGRRATATSTARSLGLTPSRPSLLRQA
jgi:hypothetical protein